MKKSEVSKLSEKELEMFNTFKKFLTERRLYSAFKRNVLSKHTGSAKYGLPILKKFSDLFIHTDCRNLILNAFVWSRTEQGHDFWKSICIAWRHLYEKQNWGAYACFEDFKNEMEKEVDNKTAYVVD